MPLTSTQHSPARQTGSRHQPTIVIVDDTPTLLTLASRLLTSNGYRCFCCMDSRLALGFLLGIQPQLIILDLNMPSVSGDELLLTIRQTPSLSRVPVLLISGRSEALSNYAEVPEFEPLATLAKPFEANTLMAVIRRLLNRPYARAVGEH